MEKMQAIYERLGTCEDAFIGVVEDVVDRALDMLGTMGGDAYDVAYQAMDDGLIYTADQWTMIEHYCTPADANFNKAWEAMAEDVVAILASIKEDEDEDDDADDGTEENAENDCETR